MAVDFEVVRALAREIGEVEEQPGGPALKVYGKLWAWEPRNKNVEPGTLAVRIDEERRAELMAEAPEVYYLTEHYRNYPGVLVRMRRMDRDAMRDLLLMSKSYLRPKRGVAKRGIRVGSGRRGRGAGEG